MAPTRALRPVASRRRRSDVGSQLPVRIPTALEGDAHIIERLTNEGTVMIRDSNNGGLRQMRLGLADVGGTLALVVIGDP